MLFSTTPFLPRPPLLHHSHSHSRSPFLRRQGQIPSLHPRPSKTTPRGGPVTVRAGMLPPVDPWAPGSVDSQNIASQLFALSIFPYAGFLYFITRSNTAPKLTLFGFYFLLVFVFATIPAGIYAKVHYGTSLANVDWLHGGSESFLTLTNLFIVLGLTRAIRKIKESKKNDAEVGAVIKEK